MRKRKTKEFRFDEVLGLDYHEILGIMGVKIDEYVSEGKIELMSKEVGLLPEVKKKLRYSDREYPLDLIYKVNFIVMIDCLKQKERMEYKYWYEFYRVFTDSPFYVAEMYVLQTDLINMMGNTVLVDVDHSIPEDSHVYFNYTGIDIKAIPEHLGYLTGLGEKVIHNFCGDDYFKLWDEVCLVVNGYEEKYGNDIMYACLRAKIDGFDPYKKSIRFPMSDCVMQMPTVAYAYFLIIIKTVMSIDYGKRLVHNYFYANHEDRKNLRLSLLFAFDGLKKGIRMEDHICFAEHRFMLKGVFKPEHIKECNDSSENKDGSDKKGVSVAINGKINDTVMKEAIIEIIKQFLDFLENKKE